jgi:triosephosphate isomerase
MRKPLVAGNWKLNGTRESNKHLVHGILQNAAALDGCDVMVCPPFVYLREVGLAIADTNVLLGAQDLSAEMSGAYTGEVSGAMLRDVGCSHAIIGHSERRALFGDTDAVVAKKFQAAHAQGVQPILCVGESLEEREAGQTMDIVERQITAVMQTGGAGLFAASIVAYEPVWAIGTGLTATPQQAQEVHAHIRGIIAAADAKIAGGVRILYGGSVKGSNASALFAMNDIDGGLIGGASLNATEFVTICRAAAGRN